MDLSIAHRFAAMAETCPDRPALIFVDVVYTYSMLQNLVQAFIQRLAEQGVGPEATLQLESRDLPVVLATLFATSSLGARLAEGAVTRALAGPYPVTHRLWVATKQAEANPNEKTVMVDTTWSPAETALPAGLPPGPADLDAPWLLLATSGTTGIPKVVGLSQTVVTRRSIAVADEFLPGKTRFVSLFPYGTRPFFARALGALLNGATIVDQGDWDFWARVGVNRVSGSLRQVKSLTIPAEGKQKIAVVEVSGAKLTDQDAHSLLAHFDLVDDTYGATETSKSFSNHLTFAPDGKLRRIGAPRDSTVEIVTETGPATKPMQIGEVRVRNTYMASRYIFTATGESPILTDGYFVPGDIARFTADGALDVIGRVRGDVLNFEGVKLSANIIDQLLTSVDGITAAASLQSPKPGSREVIAFAVFAPGQNIPQLSALARKACTDALGPKLAPVRIWPINAIPRKLDGSPDRDQCAALILDMLSRLEQQT